MSLISTSRQTVPVATLVSELKKLDEQAFRTTEQIRSFLAAHPVDPESVQPYLFWDKQHYTRNLIEKTPLFELLAICWDIGHASSIHNHRDQNCWMAVPIGHLKVQNYRVLFQDLNAGKCHLEKSDLLDMDPQNPVAVNPKEPVHKVFNPRELNARAVSLHVYSRPFDSCDVYSEEQQTCGSIGLCYTSIQGAKVRT